MTETPNTPDAPTPDRDQNGIYEIRIKGHMQPRWAEWFDGLTITAEANGETRLTGLVADQASLHGLLKKVRDLALPLIAVNPIAPAAEAANLEQQSTAGGQDEGPGKEECP